MIKTTIGIAGMMCGMCESHINDVIRREFKVKKVSSSHTKGIAEIISENEIDEEKCNGCGACALACHEGAIEMVNGTAKLDRKSVV